MIKVVENTATILAIELFNASQAISYRQPHKTSEFLENVINSYRKEVPLVKEDVVMSPLIQKSKKFMQNWDVREKYVFE